MLKRLANCPSSLYKAQFPAYYHTEHWKQDVGGSYTIKQYAPNEFSKI